MLHQFKVDNSNFVFHLPIGKLELRTVMPIECAITMCWVQNQYDPPEFIWKYEEKKYMTLTYSWMTTNQLHLYYTVQKQQINWLYSTGNVKFPILNSMNTQRIQQYHLYEYIFQQKSSKKKHNKTHWNTIVISAINKISRCTRTQKHKLMLWIVQV